jgi:nitrate/TMAO reductase-like tetraheme cytochrome c subunit
MHKPSEDYCAQCHEPVATGGGWTTEVTTTAEVDLWAPDMDCAVCHSMDPYFESLQDSNLLAYAHAEEGLACLDCHDVEEVELVHEEAVPGARISGKKVEMEACFECHVANEHTSYEQVIGRTQDYTVDDEKINPHDPHAGLEEQDQFQCSLCHRMHEESLLVNGCYGCHHEGTFENCSTCH